MPTKTIHVRKADLPTWEAAKAKAAAEGRSLSSFIEDALRQWVDEREREAQRRKIWDSYVRVK